MRSMMSMILGTGLREAGLALTLALAACRGEAPRDAAARPVAVGSAIEVSPGRGALRVEVAAGARVRAVQSQRQRFAIDLGATGEAARVVELPLGAFDDGSGQPIHVVVLPPIGAASAASALLVAPGTSRTPGPSDEICMVCSPCCLPPPSRLP